MVRSLLDPPKRTPEVESRMFYGWRDSKMGRATNEAKAAYTKRLSGKPLGSDQMEYRGLYDERGQCVAVYVYPIDG